VTYKIGVIQLPYSTNRLVIDFKANRGRITDQSIPAWSFAFSSCRADLANYSLGNRLSAEMYLYINACESFSPSLTGAAVRYFLPQKSLPFQAYCATVKYVRGERIELSEPATPDRKLIR